MAKADRLIKLKELDAQLRDLDLENADHYRQQTVRIRAAREAIKKLSEAADHAPSSGARDQS